MRTEKIQINLRIRAVWSDFFPVRMNNPFTLINI